MADGFRVGAFGLAGVSILLMLYTTQLPQYGDGAIGTFMVFGAALVAYLLGLVVAIPLFFRSVANRETLEAQCLCVAIGAPVIVGALVVLWSEALI